MRNRDRAVSRLTLETNKGNVSRLRETCYSNRVWSWSEPRPFLHRVQWFFSESLRVLERILAILGIMELFEWNSQINPSNFILCSTFLLQSFVQLSWVLVTTPLQCNKLLTSNNICLQRKYCFSNRKVWPQEVAISPSKYLFQQQSGRVWSVNRAAIRFSNGIEKIT